MNIDYYALGISVGVIFAVLLFVILRLVQKRKNGGSDMKEYDERQIIARGEAYRNGFFAIAGYNIAFALLELSGVVWCEPFVGLFFGLLIGAGVFAVTAIRKDAYLALNNNMRSWTSFGLIIIACNAIPGVISILDYRITVDGRLSTSSLSLAVAVLWLVVLLTQIANNRRNAKKMAEDEE